MAGKKRRLGKWLKIAGLILAGLLTVVFIPRRIDKPIDKLIVVTNYSVGDAAFREGIGHLVNAPLMPGNKITTLINGDQIFPVMMDAIRRAKKTVTLENFIFRSGRLSGELVPLLCEKARAGVKVHLMMDSLGCSKLEQSELDRLEQSGVQFVKYNR
ncbi:MAG TPA: hypothetical protein VNT99_16210, partial [Methylomirabilota bacterium]|nr:hypothetical protein [Methylomirabilota bacterium]